MVRAEHYRRLLAVERESLDARPPPEPFVIRRSHLLQDSLARLPASLDLRQPLRVEFIGADGRSEAGHGAGVTREFLQLLCREAYGPPAGLFVEANGRLSPAPNPGPRGTAATYVFLGRMLGKLLFDGTPVELPLAQFFLASLLSLPHSLPDLTEHDAQLAQGLGVLARCPADQVEPLGVTFDTYGVFPLPTGWLPPRGADEPVTAENRHLYLRLVLQHRLSTQISEQTQAFLQGLGSVIPHHLLSLFSAKELSAVIGGVASNGGEPAPIDVADLRNHTAYTNGFYVNHPVILNFWQILETLTPRQQHQFLAFVTGTSAVPYLGFAHLEPRFCIQKAHTEPGEEQHLPTANTCMHLLKLTPFADPIVMRERLIFAIENTVGFELS
jgi:ubiquitin-protein ligase E3 C